MTTTNCLTIDRYLAACRRPNPWLRRARTEEPLVHPPSGEELSAVLVYLQRQGARPVIVGGLATLAHLDLPPDDIEYQFRPTVDADIFVTKLVKPPAGWTVDKESIGTASWFSPTGGRVDFLLAGQSFPSGNAVPDQIRAVEIGGQPVVALVDLIRLKLSSFREKDLWDTIALLRRTGRLVTDAQLGTLSALQRENWELVKSWLAMRPQGNYGE